MTQTQIEPPRPDGPARNALGETRRKVVVRRAVIVVVVLACIAGFVAAAAHTRRGDEELVTSGSDGGPSPSVVEQIQPRDGDTLVNQQAQVGIDLTTPYAAFLIVNGTQIPEDQLLERPELSAVYFTPGDGKVIKALPAGRNCVQAVISRIDGTLETVAPLTWCFNVA
ncbi:MAG: hypothetical protein ACR2LQ_14070 [Acidimicrobiales bacterium]